MRTRSCAVTVCVHAARGQIGDDDGNDGEQQEGGDIGRVGDREGVDRRQEEEVVAERGRHGGQERRPEPVADGDADNCRQEHEIDVLDAERGLHEHADAERDRDGQQGDDVGQRIEGSSTVRRPASFAAARLLGDLLAGDDVDADVAGPPHEVVHDRPVQDLEPARARGLADDDLRDVVLVREADHVVGDAARAGRERDGLAAEALGKAQVSAMRSRSASRELRAAPRLHAKRRPGRVQAIGKTLGVAHERRRSAGPR